VGVYFLLPVLERKIPDNYNITRDSVKLISSDAEREGAGMPQ